MKTKLIAIVGPTAVGKTSLGIHLARQFSGEIISGDSQQVYRQLAIGTAKATPEEQAKAKHHLIDVRDVWTGYSAYDFVTEAQVAIKSITANNQLPIVVGGTGLYIQSLLEGYHLGGQVDQAELLAYRKELEQLSEASLRDLTQHLTIKEWNKRRASRALELERFSKETSNTAPSYQPLIIGLTAPRPILYERINQRVDAMLAAGLLDEARWLYEHYPTSQASRAIGYKELFPYFAKEASLESCVEQLKQQSRRFAKRQLTWFSNRMATSFYDITQPDSLPAIEQAVADFLAAKNETRRKHD